jgi:acetolactate synthase I/II/III large subunit
MNGAESLVRTLLRCGVDTCFANPGTSEMHFVAALDRIAGMRCILGLFEGVVTGAADGYARMAGKPAATLLHCGPGLSNGLANLHNARRGDVPIVNLVGDQATYHRPLDALLTADTEGLARSVSRWTRTARHARDVGADAAAAVDAARLAPGGVATLILPSDVCWSDGGVVAAPLAAMSPKTVEDDVVRDIAALLRTGAPTLLLLGGGALRAETLADAHRIAAGTGVRLLAPTFSTRIERGRGRFPIERLPYPIEPAVESLAGIEHLVLVGATEPVAFFAYPGKPGLLHPAEARVHVLARPQEDAADALARLGNLVGAPALQPTAPAPQLQVASGRITPQVVAAALAALLPEGAVVVDESLTFGFAFFPGTANAAPHDWLQLTGGAIGDGLPLSTGAAVASPGRRVVNLQADGSALYTVQALWTQARERLDVTTVILSNRAYAILIAEMANVGARPGKTAQGMFSLGDPDLDWVRLAHGFGVEAARADTMAGFADLFRTASSHRGPFLIELVLP